MEIIDKIGKLKIHPRKKYSKRDVSKITSIAIHHSMTIPGSSEAFARYHVSHNEWPGIGYTYVVYKNGVIDKCWDHDVKTAHVGDHNRYSLGICLVGDFRKERPTDAQLKATAELCSHLKKEIPSIKEVKGHSEYQGYEWKDCPAFDVAEIRNKMT